MDFKTIAIPHQLKIIYKKGLLVFCKPIQSMLHQLDHWKVA